jgi:hypothetical protein
VSEQPVFWLGGKPGKSNEPKQPEAAAYEAALRDACTDCGYALDEYVAAMGGFGGWLAYLNQDSARYRLFFNGKAGQLAFERAQPHGGWEAVATQELTDTGVAGFVNAVRALLADPSA